MAAAPSIAKPSIPRLNPIRMRSRGGRNRGTAPSARLLPIVRSSRSSPTPRTASSAITPLASALHHDEPIALEEVEPQCRDTPVVEHSESEQDRREHQV